MAVLDEAMVLRETIVAHRRYIHERAEVHLDLPVTSAYVVEKLTQMGYAPQRMGTSGVVALAGGKKPGKVFLLRADSDALPIVEENDLPFKSKTGNMHACGHDMHTAMLLGAAQLLKDHEDELEGTVKLMFQPAEETLAGAKMMIENGILKNPDVDAAMMIHVMPALPMPAGTAVFMDPKSSFAASDWFRVDVTGKGCHGAMPDMGIDPLNVLSHIHLAYQEINAREVSPVDTVALTIGQMHGGATSNVIPETAFLSGTLRTLDNSVREFVKNRMVELAQGIGSAFRAQAGVVFERGVPCFTTNAELNGQIKAIAQGLLGRGMVFDQRDFPQQNKGMGSEDFACVSLEVPSLCVALAAGSPAEGYAYSVHHPKTRFDETALPYGAALYAGAAFEWLKAAAMPTA